MQSPKANMYNKTLDIERDVHMILHRNTWIASTSQDAMRI